MNPIHLSITRFEYTCEYIYPTYIWIYSKPYLKLMNPIPLLNHQIWIIFKTTLGPVPRKWRRISNVVSRACQHPAHRSPKEPAIIPNTRPTLVDAHSTRTPKCSWISDERRGYLSLSLCCLCPRGGFRDFWLGVLVCHWPPALWPKSP